MRRLLVVGVGFTAIALTGCAEALNPAQQRAWDAFQECRKLAPTANLTSLSPEGGIGFQSREGDYQIMLKYLEERYGYKFR